MTTVMCLGKQQLGSVPSRWHIAWVGNLLREASQYIIKVPKHTSVPVMAHVAVKTISNVFCKPIEAICTTAQDFAL